MDRLAICERFTCIQLKSKSFISASAWLQIVLEFTPAIQPVIEIISQRGSGKMVHRIQNQRVEFWVLKRHCLERTSSGSSDDGALYAKRHSMQKKLSRFYPLALESGRLRLCQCLHVSRNYLFKRRGNPQKSLASTFIIRKSIRKRRFKCYFFHRGGNNSW